jgi:hypothetical protein
MTEKHDPLDAWLRKTADTLPVPPGLELRVRREAGRRRRAQMAAAAAAACLLVIAGTFLRSRPAPEPEAAGPVLRLSEPVRSVESRDIQFTARVTAAGDDLVFRFTTGGKSDE